jgi:pimeloyl-ACP methyl ester carboxylesterase
VKRTIDLDEWGVPSARRLTVHRPKGKTSVRGFAVFLHGFGSNQRGEKAAALRAPLLEAGIAYATYDSRGTGDRPDDFLDLTATHLLLDCHAVVRALAPRFGRAVLVGSSLGGFTAAWAAALRPKSIAGVALVAPSFRFLDRHVTALPRAALARWRRRGFRPYPGPYFDAHLSWDLVPDARRYRYADLCRKTVRPALILHGLEDDLVPVADSEDFLRRARSKEIDLVVFKSGDHRLTEKKDEIAALVAMAARRFLGG